MRCGQKWVLRPYSALHCRIPSPVTTVTTQHDHHRNCLLWMTVPLKLMHKMPVCYSETYCTGQGDGVGGKTDTCRNILCDGQVDRPAKPVQNTHEYKRFTNICVWAKALIKDPYQIFNAHNRHLETLLLEHCVHKWFTVGLFLDPLLNYNIILQHILYCIRLNSPPPPIALSKYYNWLILSNMKQKLLVTHNISL